MKTLVSLFLLLILLSFVACNRNKTKALDNKISIGTIESIHSSILNEERKIWVYIPESNNLFVKQTYPVVYLLDGDAHFYSVMGMIQQLSEVNVNMVLPQMIVIGITNTDRWRDLSTSNIKSYPPYYYDSPFLRSSGGAENFTSFIRNELIPLVDSLYPTAPYRILIGHSLGGLFAINTLLNHTDLFNAYISIDPCMDWDDEKLLNQAPEVLAKRNFEGISLFLAIANSIEKELDTLKVKKDTSLTSQMLRSNFKFTDLINANTQNNLKFNWNLYRDDDHPSVPLIAEYDGLRFIFDFFNLRLYYPQLLDPSFKYDSLISAHFKNVSHHIGYSFYPPESYVNFFAYFSMTLKQYDKAFSLYKMNIENYPASPNAYKSMGDLLLIKGDTSTAIKNYEESLKLDPKDKNTKNKIERLRPSTQIND